MSPFDRAPFIVIWETTRACALACVHCRAEANPHRNPDELTTEEGTRLIDQVAAFGDPAPILVLTGGDPLRRPDIVDLVAHARAKGVSVSLTPSGTGAVTEARLRELKAAGLSRLAVSLDGATAQTHDAFRMVVGSHRHTMRIIERARQLDLPLQINTTVCRWTVDELPELARRMEKFGVVLWALFFLIPVGRAQADQALSADEIERVLTWAADLAGRAPFGIKTTEAPHYHRVLAQRAEQIAAGPRPARPARARPDLIGRAGRAVTDGNGFVFIDHLGNICPSGFLPRPAGNVREADLLTVYREDPLFVALRDPSRLGGRCGRCEFRDRCGGSRARAYAATGDPLAEDPGCAWQPGGVPAIAGASDAPPAVTRERRGHEQGDPALRGASDAPPAVTREQVMDALRQVLDPELGLSVVDLGLIYGIDIRNGAVAVTMTLTAPGCPIHDVMPSWVRAAVMTVPGVEHADVTLTFEPPWTPDRIGSAAAARGVS
jgi:radical SAM protein